MNFQLITESPSWLIILCVLAGILYSWILYRKEEAFTELSPWLRRLMAGLRFVSVTLLAILLLTPLIRSIFKQVEKPILVILQDQSESIKTIRDSVAFIKNYESEINAIKKGLENDFDVRLFSIGDKVSDGINFKFNEKETDLSEPVDELNGKFSGRNFGAVILATDGIYNKGNNPLYAYPDLKVPVYTIGIGDTSVRKDILISKVNHNKNAFFGNVFPVELTLDARQCEGESVTLTITKNKKVIFSKPVPITSNRMNMIIPVFLDANEKGVNHYVANVTSLDNEINYVNNTRDFFIEVSDIRQQILLVSNAPHPDISFIKSVIETNPNYQLISVLINEFDGNLSGINLAILHQVPSTTQQAATLIEKLQLQNIPVFYILGTQTNISSFNKLNTGITISDNRGNSNEVLAEPERNFSLFTMEEENLRRLSGFPPLISPFGNYNMQGNIFTLLTQRVGTVKTGMPLLFFSSEADQKTAVLAGEGIWKWRLREFSENNSTEAVSSLITKTIQYLASTEKKTPFRLFNKNSYSENEQLLIDAEYYNESGELLNLPDAKINILNESGENFPFTFSKTGKSYSLNAGYIPVGFYKFNASLTAGGKTHSESGSFTVTALQAELAETIANHNLLRSISERTGGKFYNINSSDKIIEDLKARSDIKPVSYTQKKLDDVINLKWIFGLLILLISAEWFLRKRSGAY